MFSTPYPFDKLDQVFCPDYRMGAMENVGNKTYNDEYVPRDEKPTRIKTKFVHSNQAQKMAATQKSSMQL